MELTRKQEEGLKIILDRYKAGYKYTVIAGYAGTGKSTLVKFAIEALCLNQESVAYATFTGKAAEVLRRKGNNGACTLHRLLYDSVPLKNGGFYRKKKDVLGYNIVVVDEVSMVPVDMIDILLSHDIYIIFLGDPFQLPTIDKNQANSLLDKPHIFLDEVMRQAAESEIIQLTMKIRSGEKINFYKGNEVLVLPEKEFSTGMMTWADQIICATNKTRKSLNNQMRKILGYDGTPKDGERMICLRNYWDDCNYEGDALVNGTTGILKNPINDTLYIPRFIKLEDSKIPIIKADFSPDFGSDFLNIRMDKNMIETGEKCIDWKTSFALSKAKQRIGDIEPREFEFGYAITAHKSQGSEWDKILVVEEKFPFEKEEHARWLYTACTRAAEKLVLVR